MIWLLLLVLLINLLAATWNAYMGGRLWRLVEGFGSKTVLICALVQSVVGYSSVLLIAILIPVYAMGWIDEQYAKYTVDRWYLMIIFPALGTGIVIWMHSLLGAIRHPGSGNFLVAVWNSFAMWHNISSAIEHVPEAAKGAGELLGTLGKGGASGGKDGLAAIIIIGIVALTIGLSITITYLVFCWGYRVTEEEGL